MRSNSFLRRVFPVLIFSAVALAVVSCRHRPTKPSPSGVSDDKFIDKLQSMLQPVDTGIKGIKRTTSEDVRFAYQTDEYQPIWINAAYHPNDAAATLITELEELRWDGLDPDAYNLLAIKLLKEKLDTTKENTVDDLVRFDTILTHSYLAAARHLLIGTVVPKKVDSLWYHPNDSLWNGPEQLVAVEGKHSLSEYRSKVPTYTLLRNEFKQYYTLQQDTNFSVALVKAGQLHKGDSGMMANINYIIKMELPWLETVPNDTVSEQKQLIAGYQDYMAIKPTGRLDSATMACLTTPVSEWLPKIRLNMERVRWMHQDLGKLYVVVDVPLMELFLRRDSENLMHMRVVVGKPERQTPSLYARMSNVVINPPWGVPPTILKKDVLPGIARSGRQYLDKKGLRAYDKSGKQVNSGIITTGNYKRYTYKQAPGDDNALGYVKFNLPNPWDIYLHDTPHREDFVKRFRALSSGCIRVERPQEMALMIMSQLEERDYTQEKLTEMISTHKTKWEVLKNKIPVYITYLTAFEDSTGSHIRFARDVYQRDEKLLAQLK